MVAMQLCDKLQDMITAMAIALMWKVVFCFGGEREIGASETPRRQFRFYTQNDKAH